MGEWVDTKLGRRYRVDNKTSIAFFLTEPDKNGNRNLPRDALEIIIQSHIENNKEVYE